MAVTAAIIGAVAATTGAGYAVYSGETGRKEANDAAEKQKKEQDKQLAETRNRALKEQEDRAAVMQQQEAERLRDATRQTRPDTTPLTGQKNSTILTSPLGKPGVPYTTTTKTLLGQ